MAVKPGKRAGRVSFALVPDDTPHRIRYERGNHAVKQPGGSHHPRVLERRRRFGRGLIGGSGRGAFLEPDFFGLGEFCQVSRGIVIGQSLVPIIEYGRKQWVGLLSFEARPCFDGSPADRGIENPDRQAQFLMQRAGEEISDGREMSDRLRRTNPPLPIKVRLRMVGGADNCKCRTDDGR